MKEKLELKPITKFDASEIPIFNAGEIQDFPFDKYFVKKESKIIYGYLYYAIYAAMRAIENSGLNMEEEDRDRVGIDCILWYRWFARIGRQIIPNVT